MRAFKSHTIRRRLIVLFGATVGFVVLLAGSYSVNIFALKSDVIAIENFYTLFNNVLELRRYEKNFIYGVGSDNFQQIIFYLDTIENEVNCKLQVHLLISLISSQLHSTKQKNAPLNFSFLSVAK